jgi:GDP-L-fucose synthase
MIQSNVIHESYQHDVKKLLFLGSSCIYPKLAPQPLKEEYLLTGLLEPTNEPYAIAKIAGIKMIDAYRSQYGCNYFSVMPTNLYGNNDNFDLSSSHVLPALLNKIHNAKVNRDKDVMIWGSGKPRREFLHADDAAKACLLLMQKFNNGGFVNVGIGEDLSISELAELIKKIVGYKGELKYDITKPDGTPRKLMDIAKLRGLGWQATIPLQEGIEKVYQHHFPQPIGSFNKF